MYANVYAAEKLSAFHRAEVDLDLERRRVIAVRTPRPASSKREPVRTRRGLAGLVPRFARSRVAPA